MKGLNKINYYKNKILIYLNIMISSLSTPFDRKNIEGEIFSDTV